MEDLYIIEQGCSLKKKSNRFVVMKNGIKLSEIPLYKVGNILLFGNQSITTQAVNMALENGIDVQFLNLNGKLKGKLTGSFSKNIYLRLIQYNMWINQDKKISIAKDIIRGKINNQFLMLKKYNIKNNELFSIAGKLENAESIDEIMGIEGIASKYYFSAFRQMIPDSFAFYGRNRRPPKDEVNALLSLTYTMVLNRIISAVDRGGLDGYMGFLHGIKYGRESLSLDLLEEFRQGFCDPFVVKLLNRKEIRKEHFHKEGDGVIMTEDSFRLYINKFNSNSEILNESIQTQISLFKKVLLEDSKYTSMTYASLAKTKNNEISV